MFDEKKRPSERIQQLKKRFDEASPTICIARALAFTKSHEKTEGQPVIIRRAKAFREVCGAIPVIINDNELIVGQTGKARRSALVCPEIAWKWVEDEMDTFETRKQDPYKIKDEDKELLKNYIFPYWKGNSLEEAYLARIPEETAKISVDTGIVDNDSKWRSAVGEITPDYQDIIFKKGFLGIKEDANNYLEKLEPINHESIEKMNFYTSIVEVCEGIITLGNRYSEKARKMAATEKNEKRREELMKISRVCRQVPGNPPRDLWEALQMIWFVQIGGILSENPLAFNLGRFDQYTYPFYKNDIENKRLTIEQAQELLDCLWIKLSEWVWAISQNTANYFAGYNSFQNLTVGGRKRNGTDATNDISYMCLQATADTRTHQPGLSVRIHSSCPPEFLLDVCKLVRVGTGFPAIHNDRTGMEMLLAAGLAPEDARDWSNCGCVVPHFRKIGEWTSAVNLNLAAAIEYALNNGKSRITKQQMGLCTGDPVSFNSFEEFKKAYYLQLANLIKHSVIATVVAQEVNAEIVPRPFMSALVGGCLESGRDLSKGGAAYTVGAVVTSIGLADVVNSFAAVKQLVFEEKKVSMQELYNALENNWEGYEWLRQMALRCPKYGNDNDYVDAFAVELTNFVHEELRKYRDWWGKPFNSAFMGISNYMPMGAVLGATPDGRLAMTPLTEGCSPHAGTDITSPTAAMKSISKISHESHSGGTLLNLKFNPEALENDNSLNNLAALIRAYFELGAFHVQFNVVSPETLKDAQKHPEKHANLLVRVAGYSAKFVTLSKEVQDAIIERTSYKKL